MRAYSKCLENLGSVNMKSFVTKTGEVAYVLTDSEKEIVAVALRQLLGSLPSNKEVVMHE